MLMPKEKSKSSLMKSSTNPTGQIQFVADEFESMSSDSKNGSRWIKWDNDVAAENEF